MRFHGVLFAIATLVLSSTAVADDELPPASSPRPAGQVGQPDTKLSPELFAVLAIAAAQAQVQAQARPPASAAPSAPPGYHDVVFVKLKDTEGFQGLYGSVISVNEEELLFASDDGLRLFDRGSFRAVILDPHRRGPKVDRWRRLLPALWSSPRPFAIELAQSLPWIGTPLRTLDRLPPFVASLIAILLTLVVLVWIALRLQEGVVDAAANRRLSRLKLELEVAKARYEVLALVGAGSPREREAIVQIPLPDFGSAGTQRELVHKATAPFWRRAFDAIFVHMGSAHRFREDVLARTAEWHVRFARNRGAAIRVFSRRRALQVIGELLLFLWGPVLFVVTVYFLPEALADKSPTSDPELASALAFSLVPYILAGFFWFRVRRDRLVTRTAFMQAKSEYDAPPGDEEGKP